MAIKIEDGTGVAGANAYISATDATAYLVDRGRKDENSWDTAGTTAQNAAIISATDYIERRWGDRFLGRKEFQDISAARATLSFTGQPLNNETVVIGSTTYTFGSGVTIGASVAESIDNLVAAIADPTVTAKAGVGDTMIVEAVAKGTAGNGIITTTTVTAASWSSATLLGGGDVAVPQALSFPRINLLDREGLRVLGIPEKLRQATAEYAVRAVSSTITLMPDPIIDDTGRTVVSKREVVGPVEEETKYEAGGALSQVLRPYPTADRLLSEYIASTGRIFRG